MDIKIKEYLEKPSPTEQHANTLANKFDVDMRVETASGVAFMDQVRAVRAIIIHSSLEADEISELYPNQEDVVEEKLSQQEIDRLVHLVITASSLVGAVYLEKDDTVRMQRVSQLQKMLDTIREKTKAIKWGHRYSNYAMDSALFGMNKWIARYRTAGNPKSDDLGEIVSYPGAHPHLQGISVNELKNKLTSEYNLLVIAPAASSGVLQARRGSGVFKKRVWFFCHYRSSFL